MCTNRHACLAIVMLCALAATAIAAEQRIPAGYRIETIKPPDGVSLEVGGLTFHPNGDLYVVTRFGEVWTYRQEKWKLFADGLHQPLGIAITPQGRIFVAQRPELTELIDGNGDGRADDYRTVCDAWGYSGNYHEFAFGPVMDRAGNFYLTLNCSSGAGRMVADSRMGQAAPDRGWCVKITPDGKMSHFANGLRSPAGIGITPDDDIFVTDNQGDWVSTSAMYHIESGKFYGHPASLPESPDFQGKDPKTITSDDVIRARTLPAVWLPHAELSRSPGEPTYDATGGKFGPFGGQLFFGDQGDSNVIRASLEKVGGSYQGVAFEFVNGLKSGPVRSVFSPDGRSLYVGETGRGWGTQGGEPFALQRIVYDGKTLPHAIETIRATPTGFKLVFTQPVDRKVAAEAGSYTLRHWEYKHQSGYIREQKLNVTGVTPTGVAISDDGKTVDLQIPGLKANRVYEITANVPAADGGKLATATGFYTLNHLKQ